MTTIKAASLCAAAIAVCGVAEAQEAGAPDGFYVRGFGGVTFLGDLQQEEENLGFVGNVETFGEVEFDFGIGGLFGANAGYMSALNDRWSVGLEAEAAYRAIDGGDLILRNRGEDFFTGETAFSTTQRFDANRTIDGYSAGGNLKVRYDLNGAFFGYVTGGAGFLSLESTRGGYLNGALGGGYKLTKSIELSAEYRYTRGFFNPNDERVDFNAHDFILGVGYKF